MSTPQSPYELMVAAKTAAKTTKTTAKKLPVGRPRLLSDAQRAARKRANTIAAHRAIDVLRARHREEFNALAKAERHALYARIDTAYAAGLEIVLP